MVVISNTLKDARGNEVKPYNYVYCMGTNDPKAKATITQVKTLPFPEDKTI